MEILQEALKVAHEHGNAEKLLPSIVRNAAPEVKEAAVTEAVTSDKEVAKNILGTAVREAPLDVQRSALRDVVEGTDNRRDAQELLTEAVAAAPVVVQRAAFKEAVQSASESGAKALLTEAVSAAPIEATTAAVAKAVRNAEDNGEAQEILTRAMNAAPAGVVQEAIKDAKLSPETLDQIWLTIVRTFAWVLGGATAALIVTVILGIFYKVDQAYVQIMLTMFTTVAGILAGFITGQAVGTAQERTRDRG